MALTHGYDSLIMTHLKNEEPLRITAVINVAAPISIGMGDGLPIYFCQLFVSFPTFISFGIFLLKSPKRLFILHEFTFVNSKSKFSHITSGMTSLDQSSPVQNILSLSCNLPN